ncbi:MAG: hypothetical protein HY319_24960 [Armatimonadetes bacterium]|nr:hypothetical protein [Armatimonadota bacterium]
MASLFGRPGRDQFAHIVTDEIRRGGENGDIVYDREHFALTIGQDSEKSVLHLSNVYREYLRSPRRQRRRLLTNFASLQRQAGEFLFPESYQEARACLMPRLQHRLQLETLRLLKDLVVPHVLLSEDLTATVVYDTPQAILSFPEDQLERWGITFEEAMRAARDNLWAASNDEFSCHRGLYTSPWRDNYDASRLILQPLIRQLKVEGQHVVLPLHRDSLLVTGSEEHAGLEALLQAAGTGFEHPRFICGAPIWLQEDRWTEYEPPAGHPLAEEFRRLRLCSRARDYQEQKQVLEELHHSRGEDLLVAAYSLTDQTGELQNYSSWSRGVDTLLPRSERVALFDPALPEEERVLGLFDWEHLKSVVGALMEKTDHYPIRFRVRQFPSEAQLALLNGTARS